MPKNVQIEEEEELEAGEEDESEEEVLPEGRKRKSSPRTVYFSCAGTVKLKEDREGYGKKGETTLVLEEIAVTSPKNPADFNEKSARAEAQELFEEAWGSPPQRISPAMWMRRGAHVPGHKRDTVSMKVAANLNWTGQKSTATYKSWECTVIHSSNPELVMIYPTKRLEGSDAKKPNPGIKTVKITALENLRPASA